MNDKNTAISKLSPLLIVLGAACWGLIGIFTKQLSAAGCSPAQTAFLRCFVSAILLFVYLAVFDRKQLKIAAKDLWMFAGTGILSLVMFSVFYFTTIETTGMSVAAVLLYTSPCFVMIMSAIFFKEKITRRKILALIIAFLGCLCTTGLLQSLGNSGVSGIPLAGILTGLGSGFGYALYSIFGSVALKKYSSMTVTFYTFLFASAALAPFTVRTGLLVTLSQPAILWVALGISVVSTITPYLLYTLGLKYTEPGKASVLAFSEPMVATLAGILVFREAVSVYGIIGIALIFVSIIILSTGGKNVQNVQISEKQT